MAARDLQMAPKCPQYTHLYSICRYPRTKVNICLVISKKLFLKPFIHCRYAKYVYFPNILMMVCTYPIEHELIIQIDNT